MLLGLHVSEESRIFFILSTASLQSVRKKRLETQGYCISSGQSWLNPHVFDRFYVCILKNKRGNVVETSLYHLYESAIFSANGGQRYRASFYFQLQVILPLIV